MARPRKISTEVMIEIVDSYYLTRCDGNEKLMKCSLIAAYAAELGYLVEGYDFTRNMEVREHIECIKVFAETSKDVYGKKYQPAPSAYKTLNINEFLQYNRSDSRFDSALRELDAYWKRIFEFSVQTGQQNRILMQEKAKNEIELKNLNAEMDRLNNKNSELFGANNKLIVENRYLRKMLRTYLYPAIADEILKRENDLLQSDTLITATAATAFIENHSPKSFEASASKDNQIQTETEHLIKRLWEGCDE